MELPAKKFTKPIALFILSLSICLFLSQVQGEVRERDRRREGGVRPPQALHRPPRLHGHRGVGELQSI